ncbi:hypothetical protein PM082_015176 [Marasmius tenuissimus]|nr:hypothetical protein PM082_015176 [Marasmius tenuissimus]
MTLVPTRNQLPRRNLSSMTFPPHITRQQSSLLPPAVLHKQDDFSNLLNLRRHLYLSQAYTFKAPRMLRSVSSTRWISTFGSGVEGGEDQRYHNTDANADMDVEVDAEDFARPYEPVGIPLPSPARFEVHAFVLLSFFDRHSQE